MHLSSANEPTVVTLRGGRADSVELVKESGHEATGAANIFLRSSVLGCDLIYEDTGQHGEESVRAVGSQEATRDSTDGASGLGMRLDKITKRREIVELTPVTWPRYGWPFPTAMTRSPSLR